MKNICILVIDDEEIVRVSCKRALQSAGYEVCISDTGLEGIRMFQEKPFDIVIVDNKMPGISGLEVLQRIRALNPEQPVVVMSGYSTAEQVDKALGLGASNYLEKPFTPDELLGVVAKTLGLDA